MFEILDHMLCLQFVQTWLFATIASSPISTWVKVPQVMPNLGIWG